MSNSPVSHLYPLNGTPAPAEPVAIPMSNGAADVTWRELEADYPSLASALRDGSAFVDAYEDSIIVRYADGSRMAWSFPNFPGALPEYLRTLDADVSAFTLAETGPDAESLPVGSIFILSETELACGVTFDSVQGVVSGFHDYVDESGERVLVAPRGLSPAIAGAAARYLAGGVVEFSHLNFGCPTYRVVEASA